MKRGRKKDWDYIWETNTREVHQDMEIIEGWTRDWLEREKDSRWMSEEQFAEHEVEKKKINLHLSDIGGFTETVATLISENYSKIILDGNRALKIKLAESIHASQKYNEKSLQD